MLETYFMILARMLFHEPMNMNREWVNVSHEPVSVSCEWVSVNHELVSTRKINIKYILSMSKKYFLIDLANVKENF